MNNIYKKRKIIGLTLVFGLFLVVSGCFPSEKTSPDTITQPVEISDNTKNSNDSMVDNDDISDQDIVEDVDTSDWLTYRNEEYGFEIKYPNRWAQTTKSLGDQDKVIEFSNYSDKQIENNEKLLEDLLVFFIDIRFKDSTSMNRYKKMENEYKKGANEIKYHDLGDNKKITDYIISERTIEKDNISWDVILPDAKAFFENGNYYYVFHFGYSNAIFDKNKESNILSSRKEKSLFIFKQLLKTFKNLIVEN